MKDLVTVLIPVYNRQAYLAECLESVLAQTYQNYEILLIDDGSTDNSVEICRSYAQKDSRIRLFFAEHGGVSAARNFGLEQMQGEYVFFLDSDDVIHPRLLETLVEGICQTGCAVAATAVRSIWEKNWDAAMEKINPEQTGDVLHLNHEKTMERVFSGNTPLSVIGGVMMRRDYIGQTRFNPQLYIGEDFYFIYENLIKGSGAAMLREVWYYARLHQNNTWDFSYKGFMNRLYRRELIWNSEEKLGRPQYANAQKAMVFGTYMRCLGYVSIFSRDAGKMRKVLRQQRKILLPAMKWKTKLKFFACVYAPFTAVCFRK